MSDSTLSAFVQAALSAGAAKAETEQALLAAGWAPEQVAEALAGYADSTFIIPVPVPRPRLSARDTFLYFVMFGMLYLSLFNLGNLLFQFINLLFPDPAFAQYELAARAQIRFAISAVVVAFPVFLVIATLLTRQVNQDPVLRLSAARKWLTYLTLTFAACVIVGDLIFLLNNLLAGELSVRILLKTLVVGGLAAGTFLYYLTMMRDDDRALAQ